MMKIMIEKKGNMETTGNQLLRILQNTSTPTLDLLVRESIQNSVDAWNETSNNVDMKFTTTKFDVAELCENIELIGPRLSNKYKNYDDCLTICDYNTTGLTGEMNEINEQTGTFGNFQRLVYEIAMPGREVDSGGSWGYGKTVYFRAGAGLVLYYTRYKDDNGNFKQRLAGVFVEDGMKEETILEKVKGYNRGIAWFGEIGPDGESLPITDSDKINDILRIFNLECYSGNNTGTIVIIPFLNKEELLDETLTIEDNHDEKDFKVVNRNYWNKSFEEYLKISIMKWYAPRINNPDYYETFEKAYLRVMLNDYFIQLNDEFPFFKLIGDLYNKGLKTIRTSSDVNEDSIISKKVIQRSHFNTTMIGAISFTKVTLNDLQMNSPFNLPSPFDLLSLENKSENCTNRPIICFTRKPGMIVNYYDADYFAKDIISTLDNEFIIGIFVLNSNNTFKEGNYTLEEYVRNGENADHISWVDSNFKGKNCPVVRRIHNAITKEVNNVYSPKDNKDFEVKAVGVSKLFGSMFLPPDGYGRNSTTKISSSSKDGNSVAKKRVSGTNIRVLKNEISSFENDAVKFDIEIACGPKVEEVEFDISIDSEGSSGISVPKWEATDGVGKKSPICFGASNITISGKQGVETDLFVDNITRNFFVESGVFNAQLIDDTVFGTPYKIKIGLGKSNVQKNIKIRAKILIDDKVFKGRIIPKVVR